MPSHNEKHTYKQTSSLDATDRCTPALQLLDRLGRKRLTVANFAICGTMCALVALLPTKGASPILAKVRVAAAVGGKFGGAAAFILLYVYTIELFPTVVRNAALGANSSAARLGAVLAPLIVLAAAQMNIGVGAFFVFGLTSFLAGVLLQLPAWRTF